MANKAAPVAIKKSVGEGGVNQPEDVAIVQTLLNLTYDRQKVPKKPVPVDGEISKEMIAAIREYQAKFCKETDGLVEPGNETITKLNETTPVYALFDGKRYLDQDRHGKPIA